MAAAAYQADQWQVDGLRGDAGKRNGERRVSRYVYFAQASFGGPIKIGCSYNETARVDEISKDLPYEMVVLGAFKGNFFRERFVQCWFHHVHLRGEWFGHHPEIWRWAFEAKSSGNISAVPPSLPSDKSYAVCVEFISKLLQRRGITREEIASVARIQLNSVHAALAKPYLQSSLMLGAVFSSAVKRDWRFPGWDAIRFRGKLPSAAEERAGKKWKLNDPPQKVASIRGDAA